MPNIEAGSFTEVEQKALPTEDFYSSANHEKLVWLKNKFPSGVESRNRPFNDVHFSTRRKLIEICKAAVDDKEAVAGSNIQLVGDFYRSGMDMETRNSIGIGKERREGVEEGEIEGKEGIRLLLSEIEKISSSSDVIRTVATLHSMYMTPFFSHFIGEDFKKAGNNVLYIYNAGLGMPNRDYYLKDDEAMKKKREEYKQHISNMFGFLGHERSRADEFAGSVFQIEYMLAEASTSPQEARERDKNYNKFTKDEAKEKLPDVDWEAYFEKLGVSDIKEFVIGQPAFISRVGAIVQNTDLRSDIKNYLTFTVLNSTAHLLSERFLLQKYEFIRIMYGMKRYELPLPLQVIEDMHKTELTEAIGPLYCKENFDQADKKRVMEMADNIKESFAEKVEKSKWMTDETRARALTKVRNVSYKIGFPDKWRENGEWRRFSGIKVEKSGTYVGKNLNLWGFAFRQKLEQLRKPFDKDAWAIAPTAANAISDFKRSVTIPAAMFQYPFYDRSEDDAYNYGAIGTLGLGHETSHMVDDQGRKFDEDGNMIEWWIDKDEEEFERRSERYVEHFGKYEYSASGKRVNGRLTLGENIADTVGVEISLDGYHRQLKKDNPDASIDELNKKNKLFFTAYARAWFDEMTPGEAHYAVLNDKHAPGKVRTNGVLSITRKFLDTYGVKEGHGMYIPPQDCPSIWD